MQGTAADLMKLAMIRLHAALASAGRPARLLLQVHDELILEADEGAAQGVAALAREVMEGVATLRGTAQSGCRNRDVVGGRERVR